MVDVGHPSGNVVTGPHRVVVDSRGTVLNVVEGSSGGSEVVVDVSASVGVEPAVGPTGYESIGLPTLSMVDPQATKVALDKMMTNSERPGNRMSV